MLVTSSARRFVLVLPLLPLIFVVGLGAVAVSAWAKGPAWGTVLGCGVFASFVLWLALGELKAISSDSGELKARGLFERRALRAKDVAIGVRLQAGSRSSRYVAFATDGQGSIDLAEWQTLRGARSGVERLSRALFGAEPPTPNARAIREVEKVERQWQATVGETQKKLDDYYQSPAWRRSRYVILGLVIAYSVGMVLYQYLTGQL